MSNHTQYLKNIYTGQNPLRALSEEAAKIELQDGVYVLRGNVGDPTGPTLNASNEAMSRYYLTRDKGTGYTDHRGEPQLRAIAAKILNKIARLDDRKERNEGTLKFDGDKVFCVAGGTGGLNTALSIFKDEHTHVLVTDPFYPPWGPISERNKLKIEKFPLRAEDNYLLNENILRKKLDDNSDPERTKPVVLMYHYPHNPTGKTLSKEEAKKVAATINHLVKDFKNLYLIQEDLYLATVRSDKGIYTPLPYMNDEARDRTILVHSPSKEGHGQDRGAIVATFNDEIAKSLRGSTSFSNLGMSTGALVGTVVTLADIANGIDPVLPSGDNKNNHRYVTADYYQNKMKILGQGLLDLEAPLAEKLGQKELHILDRVSDEKETDTGIPQGTYYLWPKLDFLKGKPIPPEVQYNTTDAKGNVTHHTTVKTAKDIQYILSHAQHIGYMPVMVASGDIFTGTGKDEPGDNPELRIRLAAVERDDSKLQEAAKTLKGVIGTVIGLEPGKLHDMGADPRSLQQLKDDRLVPVSPNVKEKGTIQQILNGDIDIVKWVQDVLGDGVKNIFMIGRS